jgi:hypothetical protein
MRTATKFVAPLTDEERLRLKEIHKTDPNWRTRMRTQAILLSEKGFAINTSSDLSSRFQASRPDPRLLRQNRPRFVCQFDLRFCFLLCL